LLTITDDQAEILSKIRVLRLTGLTSITDEQMTSLLKCEDLEVSRGAYVPAD